MNWSYGPSQWDRQKLTGKKHATRVGRIASIGKSGSIKVWQLKRRSYMAGKFPLEEKLRKCLGTNRRVTNKEDS